MYSHPARITSWHGTCPGPDSDPRHVHITMSDGTSVYEGDRAACHAVQPHHTRTQVPHPPTSENW
jgi:hypothetical protein